MSSSSSLIESLTPLFLGVQQALLTQPHALTAFLPIFRDLTPSEYSVTPKSHSEASDVELSTLLAFFRDEFPTPSVSSPGLWHSSPMCSMRDLTTMEIHGRLAVALSKPQKPHNLSQLPFIVIVIILHQLAHAVTVRFHTGTLSIEDDTFPYHISCRAFPIVRFPEQGFTVEEALFGGIVGVVFEDELDSSPPLFFRSDFTKISHLFLHCRNGMTYRLDPADLEERMNAGRLTPFNISTLHAIPLPKHIRDRTCAMFNGDHLVIREPAGGDLPPPDPYPLQPNTSDDRAKCGIRRWTPYR